MNKTYCISHLHTHFSLLDGLSKPKQVLTRLENLKLDSCAITDHNSLSGSVEFYKLLTKANKKPIIGIEFSVCQQHSHIRTSENRGLWHQLFYAKGQKGWKDLLNLTYESNQPESYYYKPRLSLEEISEFATPNIMVATGHLGSTLANEIIYRDANDYERLQDKIQPNWEQDGIRLIEQLKNMFGKDNVLLEIQLIDSGHNPLVVKLAECIRQIARKTNTKCIAATDAHYCTQDQAQEQRILLCASLNTTLAKARNSNLSCFFDSDNYHIPSYSEMIDYGNTEEELENTFTLEQCSDYDILQKPVIPQFDCPEGFDENSLLREECWKGWIKKIDGKLSPEKEQEYVDRVKYELQVLQSANLANYFLIVKDIVDYGNSIGLMGAGRGSVAGSLIAYLLSITAIDPMKYNLIFERFFNSSRIGSLPDIDIDVPTNNRQKIINYITGKFGKDKTTQVSTFASLKGRNAIKAVLRSYGVSFSESNEISKYFPDPAKISAELHEQEEREDVDESSIIRYVLENDKKNELKEWVYLDKDGNLQGKFSKRFAQAIALENTKINRSTHAAGIVISQDKIRDSIPVVYDAKNKKLISALEMNDLEDIGKIKFDLLGLSTLKKIADAIDILKTGDISEEISGDISGEIGAI